MTTTATPFELDSDQRLDLICALAENGDFLRGLIGDYLDTLSEEDLKGTYYDFFG